MFSDTSLTLGAEPGPELNEFRNEANMKRYKHRTF